jgi:hypothetical protein
MQIRIVAAEVFSRRVKAKATGKEYNFREQMAVALIAGDSAPCKVTLDDDQPAYAVGVYDVEESSFYVDRDRNIALGRLRLRAVAAAGSAQGAGAPARAVAAALAR